ncbi:MAG: hypothetical protein ABEK04_00205 [Candidatus Nanohalobium sp.]
MKRKDQAFLLTSAVLLLLISFLGQKIQFHGLQWHLMSTPGGLIYAATLGGEKMSYWLSYLLKQQTTAAGTTVQVILSIIASSTGLAYVTSKSDKIVLELV